MLPASHLEHSKSLFQVVGEVLPRGAMLFTSALLTVFGPMFGKDSAWNYYIGTWLIFGVSLALFVFIHRKVVFSNLVCALASIALTTFLLGFPFPGISLEFIIHRIPMFIMISSIIAVEIGKFRTPPSKLQQGQLEKTEDYRARPYGAWNPRRSYSTGAISERAVRKNGALESVSETLRIHAVDKGVFNHMRGPASSKSGSTHSSDLSLSYGELKNPPLSWDPKTRSWFIPNDTEAIFQDVYSASRSSSPWRSYPLVSATDG